MSLSRPDALRELLPRGLGLTEDAWQSRHRVIVLILWLHAGGIPLFAVVRGYGVHHAVSDGAALVIAALLATWRRPRRRWRSLAATLGMLTSSALLVHLTGGLIDMHLHFFVMLAVITLYQDWMPFLSSIAYVVVHHGLFGALHPAAVYGNAPGHDRPWTWAAVHGMFVLGASAAGVANWRLSEDARAEVDKQHELLSVLERAAVAANGAPRFDVAAQAVLDAVCALTGWPLGHALSRPDDAPARLLSTGVWHVEDPARFSAFRTASAEAEFRYGGGLPGRVLHEGRPVWVMDLTFPGSPRAPVAREAGVKSAFAFPVLVGDEVAGVLEFFTDQAVAPDEPLLDLMAHIGTQLGRVIERERAARHLERSQDLLADAQRLTQLGSWEWDLTAGRVTWTAELYRVFGLAPGMLEPSYEGYLARVHSEDREMMAAAVEAAYETRGEFVVDHRIYREDDKELRWLHCRGRVVVGPAGEQLKMVGSAQDVTERKQSESALAESEERFRLIQRHAPNGLALVGLDGRFLQVNPAFCALVGRPEDELLGLRFQDVTHPDDVAPGLARVPSLLAGESQSYELEKRYVRPDGEVVWALLNGSVVRDPSGTPLYFISQTQDITERRKGEEALRRANQRLRELATTDALTGLPNRALFTDRLDHDVALARRESREVSLLFVDLDGFKAVNDSLGHACGDELLVEVARRLATAVRASDTVARLGGDEFAVLLASPTSPEQAAATAARILASLGDGFQAGGVELRPRASIGVACWPEDCTSKEELLEHADAAMYRAKAGGGHRFEMFQPAMTLAARERLEMERELRRAIDEGQMFLRYQPQVTLASGAISAVEALVRWAHPERGEIAPSEFIPLAEETGLIVPLGTWVVREACRQLAEWRDRLPEASTLRVAVNVSAHQLNHPGFVALVREALDATSVPASQLELEITESTVVAEGGRAAGAIGDLRAHGVTVAIDDFGTGYSSLAYLSRFRVDRLKLDRSFIARLHEGQGTIAGDAAIVAAAIRMAQALGLEAVAEGVETGDQLRTLLGFGCEQGQGFLWSEPILADEVAAWLSPVSVELLVSRQGVEEALPG